MLGVGSFNRLTATIHAEDPVGNASPPDTLSDGVRADILAAVDRANAAWANAGRSLDGSVLTGDVADRGLSDDLADIADLRSRGQTRNNVNTAFAVRDVALSAPGAAIVASGKYPMEEIITHTFGLSQVADAIQAVAGEGSPGAIHVSVIP